ncbi:MAG: hypothetical protein QF405_10415 [Roseibacillus sp.]|nr:hypothetical protein [Roseibacillus sp.]MCP4731621.1 hypothetical protein [Roseibacillus sp.]MDP7308041.1 hypothetical protein [Roseibacillus sp.]MDP7657441.1 hypothetical protein [Roseibacillus sp.]HJM63787.1 hypothetical protein [Roseibacillus sp.]
MNRRRKGKPHLGFGTVVFLMVAAVMMAAAGVFHVYVKNRQINVAREIQGMEERISQHKLDITTLEVRLDDQLNPILINDRLSEMSSDLRRIPVGVVKAIPLLRSRSGKVTATVPGKDPRSISVIPSTVSTATGGP